MTTFLRFVRPLAASSLLLTSVAAQEPQRKIEGELSGNWFFGNTQQVLTTLRTLYERSDSAFAFRAGGRFNYGETDVEGEGAVVSKRSFQLGANYDFRPHGDVTPYVSLSVESSFENRIARRYNGTVGMRYTILKTDDTEILARTGVASERTASLPPGDSLGIRTLGRGVTALRIRRDFNERVGFTSENSYQPALTFTGDYTILTVNVLKLEMASFAALTLSLRDAYDSRAVLRGARTNNDGELLVGILTTF